MPLELAHGLGGVEGPQLGHAVAAARDEVGRARAEALVRLGVPRQARDALGVPFQRRDLVRGYRTGEGCSTGKGCSMGKGCSKGKGCRTNSELQGKASAT